MFSGNLSSSLSGCVFWQSELFSLWLCLLAYSLSGGVFWQSELFSLWLCLLASVLFSLWWCLLAILALLSLVVSSGNLSSSFSGCVFWHLAYSLSGGLFWPILSLMVSSGNLSSSLSGCVFWQSELFSLWLCLLAI